MYVLILRRNQDQDLTIAYEEMAIRFMTWTKSLQAQDVLHSVQRFAPASGAVTLTMHDGQIGGGGRYDASEDVIGYYCLDVESLTTARALAESCPILATGGSVEIRETVAFGPPPKATDGS